MAPARKPGGVGRWRRKKPALKLYYRHGMQRVEFKTDARNLRTRGALLALGAQFEGIFRKHMILPSGVRDSAWYGIVDDDWPAVKERLTGRLESHRPS